MKRSFNGICPYCGERMVIGAHVSSVVAGAVAAAVTYVLVMVMFQLVAGLGR